MFRKKLIVKLFTVFCVSTLGIILVRSLVTGKAGQLIADLIAVWLRLDEVTAARIYFLTVGNLTEPLMAIVILIAMFVSLVLFSKHFTAYFNELADKLDELIENGDTDIKLSPELGYLENKFVKLQQKQERERHNALVAEQKINVVKG